MNRQPWIFSKAFDLAFIISPAFVVSAIALMFSSYFSQNSELSIVAWVILVMGVDVSHVYSTVYRTYFDSEEFKARQNLYIAVPLLGWLAFMMLYSIGPMVFWRALAYLAVFHFIRQQYGFMMIYGRHERNLPRGFKTLDKVMIYSATIFPLIYWHTAMPRNFNWFIEGDFWHLPYPIIATIAAYIYGLIITLYAAKEIYFYTKTGSFNLARNLLALGTAVSWFVGIVWLNSDLAFTFTNVIAHGVPYLALIWVYGHNQSKLEGERRYLKFFTLRNFFSMKAIPIFLGLLVLFAYVEEALWDNFIWREHGSVFGNLNLGEMLDKEILAFLVPLLALPQITHYLLDAFIWRMKDENTNWKRNLFLNTNGR